MPRLAAAGFRAIAPDLRGIGGTTRAKQGYDLHTLAADMTGLLDDLNVPAATVVAMDAGAPIALFLAAAHPARVRRLVLSEALLGELPGAENFTSKGVPWWFGFPAVPGLAEVVVAGHEDAYIGWFLREQCRVPLSKAVVEAFVDSYRGEEALRCGFEYYRARPIQAEQLRAAIVAGTLAMPTLAIVGGIVGPAIHAQLAPLAPSLRRVDIADCGHIVPLEQPQLFADAIIQFENEA